MLNEEERGAIAYALAQLRMAHDLRQVGSIEAKDYERQARRSLALVLDVEYDYFRGEGPMREDASKP